MKKVDPQSPEFKIELEKTIRFTDKVISQFGYAYNPDMLINEGIQMGLTRNKLIYDKRYCPCFFVTGDKEEDRICPCKPAIEHEIPNDGVCHCQIFCTPEYAAQKTEKDSLEAVTHEHSRGLTKEECEQLLSQTDVDTDELTSLLEARELGMIDFSLVDVREWMEHQGAHITGTDALVPTTSFYKSLDEAKLDTNKSVIVYCHVGSRSAHCQRILSENSQFKSVANLIHGISGYRGKITR
ncbi:sulfurtransferase [Sulfurimonas sp. MAG313]|nr:sulfurtransferase [Sulfurimonas sp. MAG313]